MTILVVLGVIALIMLWLGAPFVPTHTSDIRLLFEHVKPREKRETFIDLGAGDGRVVRMAAEHGFEAVGYEFNPIVWLLAWLRCRSMKHARVKFGPWQRAHLNSRPQTIYFFATNMHAGAKQLTKLPKQSRVVSYGAPVSRAGFNKRYEHKPFVISEV